MFGKRGKVQVMMITILAFIQSVHSIGVASPHRRLNRQRPISSPSSSTPSSSPFIPSLLPLHPPAYHAAWPKDHEVCGGNFGCTGDMTGYAVDIASPRECRDKCSQDPNCNFFTFFNDGMFSSICFQFRSCDKLDFECHADCFSGPKCDDCPTCRKNKH